MKISIEIHNNSNKFHDREKQKIIFLDIDFWPRFLGSTIKEIPQPN